MRSKTSLRMLPLAALLLASTAACTTGQMSSQGSLTQLQDPGMQRADVNPEHAAGRVSTTQIPIPTLAEMQNLRKTGAASGATDEDRLRSPALRDAALSYGARGGLAWSSKQINVILEARATQLSKTYDFTHFLITDKASGDVTVLPPVISESKRTYEQADAGKTLRVADQYYQIIEQTRFAPVAPLWHTYLIRSYTAPERPPELLLPKNDGERDLWKRYVAEGWDKGVEQSQAIFKQDLSRLERDFTGMARYTELHEKNLVSAPVVANQNLGTTGSGQDMRINDRALRITADPRLNVQRPSEWKPSVSNMSPTEAATPPDGTPGVRLH